MNEPLISIIIPIYNDEKFADITIGNIINQDYKNLEIICVDDGSTDSTPTILKRLQLKDKRIKVITQKNQGHCAARNTGITNARGEYLTLIDHDDQIHPQMISTLLYLIQKESADISVVDYKIIHGEKNISNKLNNRYKKINLHKIKKYEGTDNILSNALVMENFGFASWNKLFKNEIIKKMPDYPNVYDVTIGAGEDAFFLFKYIKACNKLVYLNDYYYFYRRFNTSLSHSGFNKYTLTQVKVFNYLIELDKNEYHLSQIYIKSYICISTLVMLLEISKSDYNDKKTIKYLYEECFYKNIFVFNKCKKEMWYRKYFMWITLPFVKFKLRKKLAEI